MLSAGPAAALAASFLWGVLSIILSPCHLASIPLVIGFVDEQGAAAPLRAFTLSFVFSAGILVTLVGIGLITGLAGRIMGDIGGAANYIIAAAMIFVGLHLMELAPLPLVGRGRQPAVAGKGILAAFLLGLIFGAALGPCTFAFIAPMLGVAFSAARNDMGFAVALFAAFALGHCGVIVLAGSFAGAVQKYLDWNERSRGAVIVKKICGALVVLGGVYLFFC